MDDSLKDAARRGRSRATSDCLTYTDEEQELLTAMIRYQAQYHRPQPNCCEVLAVLKSLGYRRMTDQEPSTKSDA
jgi:hypothetical protein